MEVDGEAPAAGKGNIVFTEHNVLPSTKLLTFMRPATFDITASYAEDAALAPGSSPAIGVATISVPPPPPGEEATKVKVKVRLDTNGILAVDSAQAVEEVEVEEPKVEPAPPAAAAAPAEASSGDAPMADAPVWLPVCRGMRGLLCLVYRCAGEPGARAVQAVCPINGSVSRLLCWRVPPHPDGLHRMARAYRVLCTGSRRATQASRRRRRRPSLLVSLPTRRSLQQMLPSPQTSSSRRRRSSRSMTYRC